MDKEIKDWIDNATYESLLEKWRAAPIGSPYFQRETVLYMNRNILLKKNARKEKDN